MDKACPKQDGKFGRHEVKATQMIMKHGRHYEEAITSIITIYEATIKFTVGMSLHQGFTLSPYLFTLATDNITKHDQNEVLQYILFVNGAHESKKKPSK